MEIIVRLVGIDAAETSKKEHEPGQPYSKKATKHLAQLVLNKTVEVRSYGLDQYKRVLGEVMVDGKNVNVEMLKAGLAEVYRGRYPKGFDMASYQKADSEVRAAEMGM